MLPTISKYIETMAEPHGRFSTLGEPVCALDRHRKPRAHAGGNAVVFKITANDGDHALKLFLKPAGDTERIVKYLSERACSLIPFTRYLPGEIYVYDDADTGKYYDAVLSKWCIGHTLDYEIRRALHYTDRELFAHLAAMFDQSALVLLAEPWAHGDLKPENIMVTPDGLRLVDFDAVWHPLLEGPANETGTPAYRHPLRDNTFFDKHIDDYSIALISATLHSLALEPSLSRRFGNRDFYLFDPLEVFEGRSASLQYCMDKTAMTGNAPLHTLLDMLRSPSPYINGLAPIISAFSSHEEATPDLIAFTDDRLWGYQDMNKKTRIPPMYTTALEFTEGLAAVVIGGYSHFIEPSGQTALDCSAYEMVKPFHGGLAAVRRGGLWGYIDRSGKEVVSPEYLRAQSFREGKARVKTRRKEIVLSIENYI